MVGARAIDDSKIMTVRQVQIPRTEGGMQAVTDMKRLQCRPRPEPVSPI